MVTGISLALRELGFDIVGIAHKLDDLARIFTTSNADVLVIDVRFEGSNGEIGLDICDAILKKERKKKIVIYSQFDDDWIVERTYKIGVLAFVRKDEDLSVLVDAIHAAHAGNEFFSPVVAQLLAWTSVKSPNPIRLLDERELKIFTLLADGISVAEAAETMHLSYKTVLSTVKSIKQKLRVDTFSDFTKLAIKFGLTTLDVKTKN